MLEIDGSDGGGQLLRSSLSLAAITGKAVRVTEIRGNRSEPGLKAQHLTAVELLAEICEATVEGASLGSNTVTFEPTTLRSGNFEAEIETAGSLTLLFDTVLPLAVALDAPLSVTAQGGTAVKWSPPLTTYRQVKLPLCRKCGLFAGVSRHSTGFYPVGDGTATLWLAPSSLSSLSLTDRGDLLGARIYSRASQDLADSDVATRQAAGAASELDREEIAILERRVTSTATQSTGSALTIELQYEHTSAGFDALGEPGKPAEDVASEAVDSALSFHEGTAVVDRHLADQLLIFLAVAGGRIRIPERTAHVETSLDLLEQFGVDLTVTPADTPVVSAVSPALEPTEKRP